MWSAVKYLFQVQTICRRTIAGFIPERLCKHLLQLHEGQLTAGCLVRSSHKQPHHAVHEAVSMKTQAQQIPFLFQGGAVYCTQIKIRRGILRFITAIGRKASKIMLPFIYLKRFC